MSLNLNCCQGSSFSIRSLFCCMPRKKKKQIEETAVKITEIKNKIFNEETIFQIEPLKFIDKDKIFDLPEDIMLSLIVNDKNQVVSLTKNTYNEKQQINLENSKDISELPNYLGHKMALLLKSLHFKAIASADVVGCKVRYENYNYSIVAIPIRGNNNKNISTVIIKKIQLLDDEEEKNLTDIINNL